MLPAPDLAALENRPPQRSQPRRRRIMIVAGEASGDMHGADLVREILARDPACEFFGIAGERMRAAGVRALFAPRKSRGWDSTELASTIQRTRGRDAEAARDPAR